MVDELDRLVSPYIEDLSQFVVESPTSYHAVSCISKRLRAQGFVELSEQEPWDCNSGKYFTVREGAIVAWATPNNWKNSLEANNLSFRIVASHTDSPSFKLKSQALTTNYGWQQVGMEIYGGGLLHTWLDRDLGLAGRITGLDGSVHLVKTPPILRISQLAPHLDRSVNDSLKLDKQAHLLPILSVNNSELNFENYLCELAGISLDNLGFYDLYAYPTEPPARIGVNQEFFASWRLDNLSSVHASLKALELITQNYDKQQNQGQNIAVMVAYDHEEIGSSSRSGACGSFLEDVLSRLAANFEIDQDGYKSMIARSVCISADAGHAVHPNYAQKHDPAHHPLPNQGPLLKINANLRYSTDALGTVVWKNACQQAQVPWQFFVSNNSVPCGSTVGPITATRLGVVTVDVGVPLLSMHSVREIAGCKDLYYLSRALNSFWKI